MSKILGLLLALFLSYNLQNGTLLRLSDGSDWQINPQDVNITSMWLTPIEIAVIPTTDPDYPFKLKNVQTGETVRAKKPQASVPPTPASPTPTPSPSAPPAPAPQPSS